MWFSRKGQVSRQSVYGGHIIDNLLITSTFLSTCPQTRSPRQLLNEARMMWEVENFHSGTQVWPLENIKNISWCLQGTSREIKAMAGLTASARTPHGFCFSELPNTLLAFCLKLVKMQRDPENKKKETVSIWWWQISDVVTQ